MYLPKVGHSASIASLSLQKCKQVEKKAIWAFLQSLGFNANMPWEVVHDPESIFGIGMFLLDNEQGIDHVKALIHHKCNHRLVVNLLTILL